MITLTVILTQDGNGLALFRQVTSPTLIKFTDSLKDSDVVTQIEDAFWQRVDVDGFNSMAVVDACVDCVGYSTVFRRSPNNTFSPSMWVRQ